MTHPYHSHLVPASSRRPATGVQIARMRGRLQKEADLENAIAEDPKRFGIQMATIATQLKTEGEHTADIVGLMEDGGLCVVELKDEISDRGAIAQLLDYGTWLMTLLPDQLDRLVRQKHNNISLADFYRQKWIRPTCPRLLRPWVTLILVAPEISSDCLRILQFLRQYCWVDINALLYAQRANGADTELSLCWQFEPQQNWERAQQKEQLFAPECLDFLLLEEETTRDWEDCRRLGFVSAGGKPHHIEEMKRIVPGTQILVRVKSRGYVGQGEVISKAMPISEFESAVEKRRVNRGDLVNPGPFIANDWAIGVRWIKTVDRGSAVPVPKWTSASSNTTSPASQKLLDHVLAGLAAVS